MKTFLQIVFVLFAAAGVCLSSASCTSADTETKEVSPADTLALAMGLRLYDAGEFESAREQFLKSSLSQDNYIRTESFLYLNALEMELGNYAAARPWLERYHSETIQILRHAAEAEQRMADEVDRLDRRHRLLMGGVICAGLFVAGIAVFIVRRFRRRGRENAPSRDSSGDGDPLSENGSAVEASVGEADISDWNEYLVDAEIFKWTPVYAEITALGEQPRDRSAKVLSLVKQEVLDEELASKFERFIGRLQDEYPSLTPGDVKLCCLSLLPLSSFARALCFGSTETNIIKQRKHVIKKKLGIDRRGSSLFEFIFRLR